jgi:hypothetical protein
LRFYIASGRETALIVQPNANPFERRRSADSTPALNAHTPALFTRDGDRTKLACRFGEHGLNIGGFHDVTLGRCRFASGSGAVVDNFVCDALRVV